MKRVTVMLVPIVMAALALATPRLASACGPLSVEAEPRVLARWPDLPERVRSAFEGREDIDACARVKLALRARFHVEVTLPDGRVAERVVPQLEDVVPILEALLVVPSVAGTSEGDVATPAAPSPAASTPPPAPVVVITSEARPTTADGAPRFERRAGESARSPSRPVRLELSAFAGARTGGGPMGLGIGMLGFADLSSWLVGLGGRVDHYTSVGTSPTKLELAALGGRRFRWGEDVAVDLVAGPAALVLATGTHDEDEVRAIRANGPPPPQEEGQMTVARLVTGARLHFRMRSSLRTFVGIDGAVGPRAGVSPMERSPVATFGLALGATLGAR